MSEDAGKYNVSAGTSQGSVIGDHNMVFQQFVTGVNSLPTDYGSRIKNFLTEYLGQPARPVPFGGREKAFAHLNEWLDEPRSQPYLLLAAPAGQGKSALLVRWSQSLLTRDDLKVAFLPVSIRYGTNLASVAFASLAARLASLYEEKIPTDANTTAEVWKGIVSEYLNRSLPDGKRLLVIMDGIDEAADWEAGPELFPLMPPEGLRVVISARYTAGAPRAEHWLAQLGWDMPGLATSIALDPLTVAGVADVLRQTGFSVGDPDVEAAIASKLHHLSEGDPLVVNLYVKDLLQSGTDKRFRPEDLQDISPGLDGYFERWWREQNKLWDAQPKFLGIRKPLLEAGVQALLLLLSCARGPLKQDDILRLEPELKSFNLGQALDPLDRFIVGDGKRQGYVFSHSKLRDYFNKKPADAEREDIETRFLNWGAAVVQELNEGRLRPDKVSPYLVQFYSTHAWYAEDRQHRLASLVSNGWRMAWEAFEGTYAGFLGDVKKAWRVAEEFDEAQIKVAARAPQLGGEIRCALCQASVNSLAGNIPPVLLSTLVAKEMWTPTQAVAYALQIPAQDQMAEALVEIAPYAKATRDEILERAVAALNTIESESERALAQTKLLPRIAEIGNPELALKVAVGIPSIYYQFPILLEIVQHLPEPLKGNVVPKLPSLLKAIKYPKYKDHNRLASLDYWFAEVLAGLASHLPEPERASLLQESLGWIISGSKGYGALNYALGRSVRYLPEALLGEAIDAARKIRHLETRAEALASISLHLSEPLKSEIQLEALAMDLARGKTLDQFAATHPVVSGILGLAPSLPASLLTDALAAVLDIENEYWRSQALAGLSKHLPEPLPLRALEEARKFRSKLARARALIGLAPALPEHLRLQAIDDALSAAWSAADEHYWVEVLVEAMPHLTAQSLKEALSTALAMRGEAAKEAAIMALIQRYVEAGRAEEIWEAARNSGSPGVRAHAAAYLASSGPKPLADSVLEEGVEAACEIKRESARAQALEALAPHLSERLLERAVQAASEIIREEPKVQLLSALSPHLSPALLEKSLAMTRELSDDDLKVSALLTLSLHMEGQLREEILAEAKKAAGALVDHEEVVGALTGLAKVLAPAGHMEDALALARSIDGAKRSVVLVELGPYLTDEQVRDELTEVRKLKSAFDKSFVIKALSPYLTRELMPEALTIAHDIESTYDRSSTLGSLVLRMEQLGNVESALSEVLAMDDSRALVDTLKELFPRLPEPLVEKAVQRVGSIRRSYEWGSALAELAPCVNEQIRLRLLAIVREIEVEEEGNRGHLVRGPGSLVGAGLAEESNLSLRVRGLIALLPHLPQTTQAEVVEELRALAQDPEPTWLREMILAGVSPYLPESEKAQAYKEQLAEAIEQARASFNDTYNYKAIGKLASQLPESLLEEALTELQAQETGWDKWSLGMLAVRQAELGRPDEAIAIARRLREDKLKLETLTRIATRLPGSDGERLIQEALATARGISDQHYWVRAVAGLAPHLPEPKEKVLVEILGVARALPNLNEKARALGELAPHLPEPFKGEALREALDAALAIPEGEHGSQSYELSKVTEWMAEAGYYGDALAVVPKIASEFHAMRVLKSLAPKLSVAEVDAALAIARSAKSSMADMMRADVLLELAVQLPEPQRSAVIGESLAAAGRKLSFASSSLKILRETAPQLSETLLKEFIESFLSGNSDLRGEDLSSLVPHLPEPLLREALKVVQAIPRTNDRLEALRHFPTRLAELGAAEEALSLLRTMQDKAARAGEVIKLAPHLTEPLMGDALRMAEESPYDWQRAMAVVALAPYLPALLFEEVLEIARRFPSGTSAEVLAAIAPSLAEPQKTEVLKEVLAVVREKSGGGIAGLPGVMGDLAPHFPEELLAEAFAVAQLNDDYRIEAVGQLANRLLEIAPHGRYRIWAQMLHVLCSLSRKDMLENLSTLGPLLAEMGGAAAVEETAMNVIEVGRWWP